MPTTLPARHATAGHATAGHATTGQADEDGSSFRVTGRTVLLIFCGFFGFIFLVNAIFMHYAFSTFGGIDSAGAYRANFLLTKDIAAARKQNELGWTVHGSVRLDGSTTAKIEITAKDKSGSLIDLKSIEAELRRPADERQDGAVSLKPAGIGRYTGEATHAGPGNWMFVVTLHDRKGNRFHSKNRLILK